MILSGSARTDLAERTLDMEWDDDFLYRQGEADAHRAVDQFVEARPVAAHSSRVKRDD